MHTIYIAMPGLFYNKQMDFQVKRVDLEENVSFPWRWWYTLKSVSFWKIEFVYYMKKQAEKNGYFTSFSQHFNNYAQTVELLHVFWCFLFLLSSFLWTCHIVCDKFFILQPQLFIYVFSPQIFIFYGFKLILSVFDIAPLIAPYFSPVLNFL